MWRVGCARKRDENMPRKIEEADPAGASPVSDGRAAKAGTGSERLLTAIYLKHRPADYETVRRLLGHRSIQTTIMFYCGLQTTQATEQFGKLIRQQIKFDPVD
jgi:hypothetical protein